MIICPPLAMRDMAWLALSFRSIALQHRANCSPLPDPDRSAIYSSNSFLSGFAISFPRPISWELPPCSVSVIQRLFFETDDQVFRRHARPRHSRTYCQTVSPAQYQVAHSGCLALGYIARCVFASHGF